MKPTASKNQPSIVVRGRVISGSDLREYAMRNGLCPICGVYQTHERGGSFLRPKFEPMTVTNVKGEITVYKGYCIAPTCYSLEQAKMRLGEVKSIKRSVISSGDRRRELTQSPGPQRVSRRFQPSNVFQPPTASGSGNHLQSMASAAHTILEDDTAHATPSTAQRPGVAASLLSTPGNSHYNTTPGGSHNRRHNPHLLKNMSAPLLNDSAGGKPAATADNQRSSENSLVVGSHLKPPPSTDNMHHQESESNLKSEDPIIGQLETKIEEHDYLEFLNLFDHRAELPEAVLEGFRLFRHSVVEDQMEKPDGVVIVGDSWVKVINDKINRYHREGDREILISGLLTLLTFSRLPGSYKKAMVRKDGLGTVAKLMEERADDTEIVVLSCSIVASLAMNEKYSLNAKSYAKIATLIRRLVAFLFGSNQEAQKAALGALYYLANQRKKSEATGKPAVYDIYSALNDRPIADVILEIIQVSDVSPSVIESGLGLLWRLSSLQDDGRGGSVKFRDTQFKQVASIMQTTKSSEVMEAASALLSNLSLEQDIGPDLAHDVTDTICNFFVFPENRRLDPATASLHALCNMLANKNSKPGVLMSKSLIATTLTLLEDFIAAEELVEHACLVIGHSCVENPVMRETWTKEEAFPRVQQVFDLFVSSRGEDPSLEIKDASLCAFASLSGCKSGAAFLAQSGLVSVFTAMEAIEVDRDFRTTLETILANCDGRMDMGSEGGQLAVQPARFSQLIERASSEREVLFLIQELRDLGKKGFIALGDNGFHALLKGMTKYEYSPTIQQECGAYLAEVFSHVKQGEIGTLSHLPGGIAVLLHRQEIVSVICNAMRSHRNQGALQANCISALINFFLPFHEMDPLCQSVTQIQLWLDQVWNNVFDALSYNAHDVVVQEAGFSLCWSLVVLSSENDLRTWKLRLLQQIFDTTRVFRSNNEINLAACEVLLRLMDDHECIDYTANSSCIETLVLLLTNDSDIVLLASSLLAKLAKHAFTAVNQLMQLPNILKRLTTCINANIQDSHISIHVCMILQAIINFEDVSVRAEIGHDGGVQTLCRAMDTHPENHTLGKYACSVLALILPCLTEQELAPARDGIEKTLLAMLDMNVDHPSVAAAVVDSLGALCRDEHFLSILIRDHELQIIVQAMTLHLGEEELQLSCCRMLWLLSGFGDGKRLIGQFGGITSILNAMLAHSQSTLLQKEALTALKNLATEPSNKPIIAAEDGTRVVMYALWINYRDPSVISVAMSALNNIAVDSSTRSVAFLPPEILDIVISALKRFPEDESIHKNACFYLKSCAYRPENIQLMQERSFELTPLLQYSSQVFPEQCYTRTQSIMRKISPAS